MARSSLRFPRPNSLQRRIGIRTARVHGCDEFHRIVDDACYSAAVERNENALVTYRIFKESEKHRVAEILAESIEQLGDGNEHVGWISDDKLGVFLLGSCRGSATAYGETISYLHAELADLAEWQVEPLHEDWGGNDDDANSQNGLECHIPTVAIDDLSTMVADGFGTQLSLRDSRASIDSSRSRSGDHFTERRPRTTCPCPSWKRAIDLCGAITGLLILSPLLIVIAAVIKLGSRGPVFFRQQRYGLHGKPFFVWKFRTLETRESPDRHASHLARLMASDSRLAKRDREHVFVPGGRLMRKFGVDELPQLINVLVGEMSLVGPRPDVVPYEQHAAWQRSRFDIVPGITGLWQVNGKNETTFSTMMRLDVAYVRRRSLILDLAILARTIPAIIQS